MGVLANAGENIEGLAAVWTRISHTVGRDYRQAMMFRQVKESPVDPIFPTQEMPLDFNKDIFGTEEVDQKLGSIHGIGTLGAAEILACRFRRLPGRAAKV